MFDLVLTVELNDLVWNSDWNGYEVGFPEVDVVSLFDHEREDGVYNYYIDLLNKKVLGFWKQDDME